MRPWRNIGLALLVLVLVPAVAQADERVIVAFEESAGAAERRAAREGAEVRVEEQLPLPATQVVAGPGSAGEVVAALERSDAVRYAEPDALLTVSRTPNDLLFASQWAWNVIDAPAAWDRTVGDASVRVGVVDTGVQLDHPDLAANVDTGADRDYVNGDDTAADDSGHGTHVAGTIGAATDNLLGVAGLAWRTTLVSLKACNSSGSCPISSVAAAFASAGARGLSVVNASFGGPSNSTAMREAIEANPNVLYVAAAGNETQNNDVTPQYPCSYTAANLVCVAASTPADGLGSYSNYGSQSVDLAAPGSGILSTTLDLALVSLTGVKQGTSMAAPHVAGAAALIRSAAPAATVAETKRALLDGAEVSGPFSGKTVTGGRLNVDRALATVDPRPANTVLPAVSGTARAGQTVSCALGSWSSNPSAYAVAWLVDGAERASGTTLALGDGDAGRSLACRVTATSAGGTWSATSAAVTVTAAPVPSATSTTPSSSPAAAPSPAAGQTADSAPDSPAGSGNPSAPFWITVPFAGTATQAASTTDSKGSGKESAGRTAADERRALVKCKAARKVLKRSRDKTKRKRAKAQIREFC